MIEIKLTSGQVAVVDEKDAALKDFVWYQHSSGYVRRMKDGKSVFLHKEVAQRMAPGLHEKAVIHFYDRNPLNCCRDNISIKSVKLVTISSGVSGPQCQVLVSPEDLNYLNQWSWRVNHDGYVVRSQDGMRLHRLVAQRMGLKRGRLRMKSNFFNCRRENVGA
jgi:hypothetical protein